MNNSLTRFLSSNSFDQVGNPSAGLPTCQATPRWAHSWATLTPVVGSVLRRLVGSMSFSSFLPITRYTRPRLPSGGSLGPHFPTFSVNSLSRQRVDTRYYARLRLPLAHLGVLCSRSATDTLFVPFVRVLSSSSPTLRNFCVNTWPAWSPGTPFPDCRQGNKRLSQVPRLSL